MRLRSRLVPLLGFAVACSAAEPSPSAAPTRPPEIERAEAATSTAPIASAPVEPRAEPPPAPDPTGLVPPVPDESIVGLPVDVRLPDWATVLATHRRDCQAFPAKSCELVADFDGDGADDRAVKIRETSTRRSGIAIRWATGVVSIIGAGLATRQLSTDVLMESVDLSWNEVEDDLSFLEHWSVVRRAGTGFVGAGPKSRSRSAEGTAAPGATGAGIQLSGSDAAEVLYWDGIRWRRLILGF